jgi:hypothetical protein
MKHDEITRANRSGAVDFSLEVASPEELVVLGFVDEPSSSRVRLVFGNPMYVQLPLHFSWRQIEWRTLADLLKGAPLHRSVPEPRIHARDRVLLALAARVFGSVLNATIIVRPKG